MAHTILYLINRNKLTIKQPRKFVLNFAFSSPKIKSTKPGQVRSSSWTPRVCRGCGGGSFFRARLGVNFGVALLLVRSGKLPAAGIARKWFLSWAKLSMRVGPYYWSSLVTCVSAYVRRKVVRPAEWSHTYSALERFLAWNTMFVSLVTLGHDFQWF